jgi:hypothetical protein
MTIETPEHWSGETRRLAELISQNRAGEESPALLAIAVELAALRKSMEPQTDWGLRDQLSPEHIAREASVAVFSSAASLRLVGWYCPGGHSKDREFHDIEETDPVLTEPNVRLADPCAFAVPMYVLVK